jgi:hypothetical protein
MKQDAPQDPKKEVDLMVSVYNQLKELPPDGRQRVLIWLASALGVSTAALPVHPPAGVPPPGKKQGHHEKESDHNVKHSIEYNTFAELYDAAGPEPAWEMALVGGYWFEVCQGAEDFGAQDVNDQLKHVGANVSNITVAFNTLIHATPRLVLQIRKSGKSQQARKRYKLTVAGRRAVEQMISGETEEE